MEALRTRERAEKRAGGSVGDPRLRGTAVIGVTREPPGGTDRFCFDNAAVWENAPTERGRGCGGDIARNGGPRSGLM